MVINWARVSISLFDPGSTIDYVGTPWHYADYWGWLLEQKKNGSIDIGTYIKPCWEAAEPGSTGAEYCDEFGWVRVAFPERFSLQALLALRREKGNSEFAAQYLLDPISADTALFPRDAIAPYILPAPEKPDPSTLWIAMTVDPAISTKRWADYSALVTGGFDAHGVLHILDLRRKRMSESDLINALYEMAAKYPTLRAIGFEAIGFAKIYMRLIQSEGERRGYQLPVIKLERDTTVAKNIRIRGLEPYWNNGQLRLYTDLSALDEFLDEATRFRTDRENAHDDMLDAVVDLLQLRARPRGIPQDEENSDEALSFGDPVLAAKLKEERLIQHGRASKGLPLLDRSSLRVAVHQSLRYKAVEYARQAASLGAGKDEFFG